MALPQEWSEPPLQPYPGQSHHGMTLQGAVCFRDVTVYSPLAQAKLSPGNAQRLRQRLILLCNFLQQDMSMRR